MYDVRRLRLLREVQLRGTLSAVAAAMHQSPSSVSQQLTQLEREVGQPLLVRSGRGVHLTPQGVALCARTAVILDELERAAVDVADAAGRGGATGAGATGTVDIAVFQSAALALLPEALHLLARDHPGLRVTMTQHEPEAALRGVGARDFDLVVAEEYPAHSAPHLADVDRVELTSDAISLVVPQTSAIRSLTEAADAAWVMEPVGAASRHFAEQTCRIAGFEPDVRFSTADLQAHLALVRAGHGVALIGGLMLAAAGDLTGIRTIELAGAPRRSVFTSARLSGARHPAVLACREALAAAADLSGRA